MKEEEYPISYEDEGPGKEGDTTYLLPTNLGAAGLSVSEWMTFIRDINVKKGWYDKEVPLAESLILMVTELAELYEAYREGKLDHHCDKAARMLELGLRPLTYKEEEFADVFIRLMHYADYFGVKDFAGAIRTKLIYNALGRKYRNGGKTA